MKGYSLWKIETTQTYAKVIKTISSYWQNLKSWISGESTNALLLARWSILMSSKLYLRPQYPWSPMEFIFFFPWRKDRVCFWRALVFWQSFSRIFSPKTCILEEHWILMFCVFLETRFCTLAFAFCCSVLRRSRSRASQRPQAATSARRRMGST